MSKNPIFNVEEFKSRYNALSLKQLRLLLTYINCHHQAFGLALIDEKEAGLAPNKLECYDKVIRWAQSTRFPNSVVSEDFSHLVTYASDPSAIAELDFSISAIAERRKQRIEKDDGLNGAGDHGECVSRKRKRSTGNKKCSTGAGVPQLPGITSKLHVKAAI